VVGGPLGSVGSAAHSGPNRVRFPFLVVTKTQPPIHHQLQSIEISATSASFDAAEAEGNTINYENAFLEFLKEWHMQDYHGTDDNAPDAFEAWLEDLQMDTLLELGDSAMKKANEEGFAEAVKEFTNSQKTI
jgi:hypothetical protein